jgi:hypothetical protein
VKPAGRAALSSFSLLPVPKDLRHAPLPPLPRPRQPPRPDERPLTPGNFLETVYRHLGIDTSQEFLDMTGRPLRILEPAEPIHELL